MLQAVPSKAAPSVKPFMAPVPVVPVIAVPRFTRAIEEALLKTDVMTALVATAQVVILGPSAPAFSVTVGVALRWRLEEDTRMLALDAT